MKTLALIAFTLLSLHAKAHDLKGLWQDVESGDLVRFITVSGSDHYTSKMDYVEPDGRLSYTISQVAKIPRNGSRLRHGTISYYDSRGCSFENLPLTVEFHGKNEVSILTTTPRYKYQKITVTVDGYLTCRTPSGHYYRCGRPKPTVNHRCKVLEYVQEPNALSRIR